MSKNIVYFNQDFETIAKKHLLFLQKSGFNIVKVSDLNLLQEKIELLQPIVLIIVDELILKDIIPLVKELPIIVLSKINQNIQEIMNSMPDTKSIIFFRMESDPIDSLLETISLCEKMVS